eukprot:gene7083-7833_t
MTILAFEVEWYDRISELVQNMYLKFFVEDNTIEIQKEKSTFLKRIFYPEVTLHDLFVGGTITIHHRLYTITNYANKSTQDYLESREVRFLSIFSSSSLRRGLSQLCAAAKKHRLNLQHFFTTSSETALPVASEIVTIHSGDTVVEIVGIYEQGMVAFQRSVLSTIEADTIIPITADEMKNVLRRLAGVQMDRPCTLCLVKPHLLRSYQAGEIIQAINAEGFDIFALFSVHLTIPMAQELFDAYRGVLANFSAMIDAVTASPVLALAVTIPGCEDEYEVVSRFREFAGPVNPALAKVLRPQSLRARFGEHLLHNAVHITDLPEDGEMECRYFFEALANL